MGRDLTISIFGKYARVWSGVYNQHPDTGDLVKGSGGVRKVRWAQPGRGKRGGIRVIYFWKVSAGEIWLLTLYPKNEKSTIPGHILKQIAQEIDDE